MAFRNGKNNNYTEPGRVNGEEEKNNENIHLHYTTASPSSCLRSSMLSKTHRGSRCSMRDSFGYLIHFYYSKAFSVFHLCSISSGKSLSVRSSSQLSHLTKLVRFFPLFSCTNLRRRRCRRRLPESPQIVAHKKYAPLTLICASYQFLTLNRAPPNYHHYYGPYGLRVVWTFFFQSPPAASWLLNFTVSHLFHCLFDRGCMYVCEPRGWFYSSCSAVGVCVRDNIASGQWQRMRCW